MISENKPEDTNKLTLLAFKIIAILHNTLLATFIKLLETVSKRLVRNRSQNRCHMFLDCCHVCKTCAFHDSLQAGKQKSAGARSGEYSDDRERVRHAEPRIGIHGSHSAQARYCAATSTVQSCATLAEHSGCVVATVSRLPRGMRIHGLTRRNEFPMDDAINIVLTLDFCRRLFLGRREDSECHSIDCHLDSRSNW